MEKTQKELRERDRICTIMARRMIVGIIMFLLKRRARNGF
jgi:hypothetical protein